MKKNRWSKGLDVLSGPILPAILLPVLIVYLVIGTVEQKFLGLYEATKIYFSDMILWAWSVPLPGFPLWVALLTLCLILQVVRYGRWTVAKGGILVTHIGVILLLGGGLVTALFAKEGYMPIAPEIPQEAVYPYVNDEIVIREGMEPMEQLPFSIELIRFEKETHPASMTSRAYRSFIIVREGGQEWPVTISMNEPFYHKGYTFYQSSFFTLGDGKAISVLSVVHNVGKFIPYLACLVIALGLVMHLVVRRRG